MELKAISAPEVLALVLDRTGLASDTDPLCVESLACFMRLAASLVCPVSPRGLVSAIVDVLQPIVSGDDLHARCKVVLEQLVSQGDLVEFDDVTGLSGNRLLYRAPPSFVRISETTCLVIGVAPDGIDPVPVSLSPKHKGVLRILDNIDHPTVEQLLIHAGLQELPYSAWARAPTTQAYSEVLGQFNHLLDRASPSDAVEGLQVLNTAIPSSWYRQRWVDAGALTGRYVATRARRYGADLWCYVELLDGEPQRLVDLPVGKTVERACDQAWRLQCGLDADNGAPQAFKLETIDDDNVRLTIHLPCPAWLLRRWECIGQRANEGVFVFNFARTDGLNETKTLENDLWMVRET